MTALRICLLTTQDLDARPFPDDDWPCDPRPFLPEAQWTPTVLRKPTCVRKVTRCVREGHDLFFNLCDGAWDEDTPGIEVVQTLERLGVPFTGATSAFYEPSRESMKLVCRAWGLDAPAGVFAAHESDIDRALDEVGFPMIVKHPSSYASIGLTKASRVKTVRDLRTQTRKMLKAYGGALLEAFIEGDEYTVLVAENPDAPDEPTTYKPIRYRFPDGESFKHADLKWIDYDGMACEPVEAGPLESLLRSASARLFLGLGGASFGRCDLRVDDEGRAWLLEINANCGLYYPPKDAGGADLCLMNDPAGHEGFTRQIVKTALRRHERTQRGWSLRPRPDGSNGVFAARRFRKGETVVASEHQPYETVARSAVAHWGKERRSWFRQHAFPLTDDLWVVPGRDPQAWTPFAHACDPSAWWRGMDVVARRRLEAGDEVTLDHATYRTAPMSSFACTCGAADCRGTIRGDDHLQDFVARYGRHVSNYVLQKRADGRILGE